MEDGHSSDLILLVGENSKATNEVEQWLATAFPEVRVLAVRSHVDSARVLSVSDATAVSLGILLLAHESETEALTFLRSVPGLANAPWVVLAEPSMMPLVRQCYLRRANSVVLWPDDPAERVQRLSALVPYWLKLNLRCVPAAETRHPQVSVA